MVLFHVKPVKDVLQVKAEIEKIISRQKRGSADDLSAFRGEIDELTSALTEFYPEWTKLPVVFRVARILLQQQGKETAAVYRENVVLPDIKHDLELILKMLNHIRKEKGLPEANMPLFAQPDEMALARKNGKSDVSPGEISSQMAVAFQKGVIIWLGFVFGRDYVLLQN
ncbi:MAG: hypothetical protein ABI348_01915 [Nitrososphaera sp.]|jgi:hypothetical protein